MGSRDTPRMSDQRLGSVIRVVRVRRGWRQLDVATKARVSQITVSRIERGHFESLSLDRLRDVAMTLDIRVDLVARYRGGDLDRLLNAGHSRLHEAVFRMFRDVPQWTAEPEVSFSIYGERGIIDILAWHPGRRALLVIELKTDIADVNELVGTADRKRRLAIDVAIGRGWFGPREPPPSVSLWLVVAPSRTNRRRLTEHTAMLRAAFPADGRTMRRWLREPSGAVSAMSVWPDSHRRTVRPASRPVSGPTRRVRVRAEHEGRSA